MGACGRLAADLVIVNGGHAGQCGPFRRQELTWESPFGQVVEREECGYGGLFKVAMHGPMFRLARAGWAITGAARSHREA
jgi:hypothetical protein